MANITVNNTTNIIVNTSIHNASEFIIGNPIYFILFNKLKQDDIDYVDLLINDTFKVSAKIIDNNDLHQIIVPQQFIQNNSIDPTKQISISRYEYKYKYKYVPQIIINKTIHLIQTTQNTSNLKLLQSSNKTYCNYTILNDKILINNTIIECTNIVNFTKLNNILPLNDDEYVLSNDCSNVDLLVLSNEDNKKINELTKIINKRLTIKVKQDNLPCTIKQNDEYRKLMSIIIIENKDSYTHPYRELSNLIATKITDINIIAYNLPFNIQYLNKLSNTMITKTTINIKEFNASNILIKNIHKLLNNTINDIKINTIKESNTNPNPNLISVTLDKRIIMKKLDNTKLFNKRLVLNTSILAQYITNNNLHNKINDILLKLISICAPIKLNNNMLLINDNDLITALQIISI